MEEPESLAAQDRGVRARCAVFAGELASVDLGRSNRDASNHSTATSRSSVGVVKADLMADAYDAAPLSRPQALVAARLSSAGGFRGASGGTSGMFSTGSGRGAPLARVDTAAVGVMPMWVLRGTRVDNSHCSGVHIAISRWPAARACHVRFPGRVQFAC